MYGVPEEFAYQAMPNNKLAKNLERRGIQMEQVAAFDVTYAYFNMEDPVVGGYAPEKVALRRAITLSYNVQDEIAILRKGQAIPAQAPYPPGVAGADPNFRSSACPRRGRCSTCSATWTATETATVKCPMARRSS